MAASGNLQGHGRPNVFLAGEVGQIYKDLDSGLEYVCRGERGFIKVDGDDQSEMYNWELVESSGSTGVEPRNIRCDSDGNFYTDITIADYDRLLYDGKPIIFDDTVNRIVGICCSYWSSGSGYKVFSFLDHSGKTINLKLTVSGQDIVIERYGSTEVV